MIPRFIPRFIPHFIAAMLVVSLCAHAVANVNVGDKPKIAFKAFGTEKPLYVKLDDYKGKIVIVDFWATWCGPCMAEADHMVSTYNTYHPKGLEFIGVSLDENGGEMTTVARSKNFTWPQYFDGKGWKNQMAVEWGVHSIPSTFIIGPEGTVLWNGHPAEIDAPLAKAFKEHPPQLVDPKALATANESLDKAESSMGESNFPAAFAALAKVPASAKQDAKVAQRVADVQKSLEASAQKMLDEVDPMIAAGNYSEASERLHAIAGSLAGTPLGSKAGEKLAALQKNPQAKAAMEQAEKSQHANDALVAAQKLQTDKKDDAAYFAFKGVVKNFAGTDAAKTAAQEVATYEKDPAFVKRATEKEVGGKAKSMLSMAANYRTAGKPDLAKKKYQEVVEQFPNTMYADAAKKELSTMK